MCSVSEHTIYRYWPHYQMVSREKRQKKDSPLPGLALLCAALIAVFLCVPAQEVFCADVTLAWGGNEEPDLAGYRVFSRQLGQGYDYANPTWEGWIDPQEDWQEPVNTDENGNPWCTIPNLENGMTHCFVVRAFDTSGNESSDSNEACWTAPVVESFDLEILGPQSVEENTSTCYTASVLFEGESEAQDVTSASLWDLLEENSNSANLEFNDGSWCMRLTTSEIAADQDVTIKASYTFDNVTQSTSILITIKDLDTQDSDGDGMADAYEKANGLNRYVDDAGDDLDGDGWTNYEEYLHGSAPNNSASKPALPVIEQVIPYDNAGITDDVRIANTASFAILVSDDDGFDYSRNDSVEFIVNDGSDEYQVDVDETRDGCIVITEVDSNEGPDDGTRFWATYHRADHDSAGNRYDYDSEVRVDVFLTDKGASVTPQVFRFAVESREQHDEALAWTDLSTALLAPQDLTVIDPYGEYDEGVAVVSGDLEGAKIAFKSTEPVSPTFAPPDELPNFYWYGVDAVGTAMNLQPSTVFREPVKLFIPCPAEADLGRLSVFLCDGQDYVLACDRNGNVQPGGLGWMVPGSRVDHPDVESPGIEIQVYHFTGVQVGSSIEGDPVPKTFSGSSGGGGGGGGCFIGTVFGPE